MIFETLILFLQIAERLRLSVEHRNSNNERNSERGSNKDSEERRRSVDMDSSLVTLFTLCEKILIPVSHTAPAVDSHRKHLRMRFQKFVDLKLISSLHQREIWRLLYTALPPTHATHSTPHELSRQSKSQQTILIGEQLPIPAAAVAVATAPLAHPSPGPGIGNSIGIGMLSPKKEQQQQPQQPKKSRKGVGVQSREDSLQQTHKRKKLINTDTDLDSKDPPLLPHSVPIPAVSVSVPPVLRGEDEEVTDSSSINSLSAMGTKTKTKKKIKTEPKAQEREATVGGDADVWDITATPGLFDKFNLTF
jgi:hypothetical protein